jgi:transposase-like protein
MNRKWFPKDEERLIALVLGGKHSLRIIANKMRRSLYSIEDRVKTLRLSGRLPVSAHAIQRCRRLTEQDKREIVDLYCHSDMPIKRIAKLYGWSHSFIVERIKEMVREGAVRELRSGSHVPAPRKKTFADLIAERVYEDAPHTPEPFVQISRPIAPVSYTGNAAEMCLT